MTEFSPNNSEFTNSEAGDIDNEAAQAFEATPDVEVPATPAGETDANKEVQAAMLEAGREATKQFLRSLCDSLGARHPNVLAYAGALASGEANISKEEIEEILLSSDSSK